MIYNKCSNNTCVKVSLLLATVLSCAYLLMLGWFNHLQLDDYGFIVAAEDMGIFGMAKHMYLTWECRFSAFVVQNLLNVTIGRMSNLILLTIIQLAFAYFSIHWLFKSVFQIKDKLVTWSIAIITANIAIMSYFELSTFYWLSAAWYNLPIFTTICLVVLIFYSKAPIVWRWIGVFVCTLYLTGCPENYVPIVIFSFACCFVYYIWHYKLDTWKRAQGQMIFVVLVLLTIGMLSMILGPGNKVRLATMGVEDTGSVFQHLLDTSYLSKSFKALVIFTMRLFSRSLYYLLLIPVFLYIGYTLKQDQSKFKWFNWKNIGWLTLAMICLVVVSVIVSVYGIGWYAPLRSYCFISFIMVLYFATIGVCLGGIININHIAKYGCITSNMIIAALSLCFIVNEYPIVKDYSNQITNLQDEIKQGVADHQTTPLYVSEIVLPTTKNTYARMRLFLNNVLKKNQKKIAEPNTYTPYMSIKLSKNPSYFVNKGMQEYYDADFEIIGWIEEEFIDK